MIVVPSKYPIRFVNLGSGRTASARAARAIMATVLTYRRPLSVVRLRVVLFLQEFQADIDAFLNLDTNTVNGVRKNEAFKQDWLADLRKK